MIFHLRKVVNARMIGEGHLDDKTINKIRSEPTVFRPNNAYAELYQEFMENEDGIVKKYFGYNDTFNWKGAAKAVEGELNLPSKNNETTLEDYLYE